jgi:hypothetical protein
VQAIPQVDSYLDPWAYVAQETSTAFYSTLTNSVFYEFGRVTVSNLALGSGYWDDPTTENQRLVLKDVKQITSDTRPGDLTKFKGYIGLTNTHKNVDRVYPTLMDVLGTIGGVIEIMIFLLPMIYAGYFKKLFRHDICHKGLMMTGKYGVKEEEAFYLSELYSKNHFENPKVCEKNCFRGFWKRICSCFMDEERVKEREHRERVREREKKGLDRIFESLLDRQTDFKHIIQLVQDVEIIKKVLFQERHLVLAPLVT